jgi:hypothetical protein
MNKDIRVIESLVFTGLVKIEVFVTNALKILLFDELLEVQGQLVLLGLVHRQKVHA